MALIKKERFSKITKDRIHVHEPAEATYSVFMNEDATYFQIDTYGSDSRKDKGKISQSIQIDREMAFELIEILHKEFNFSL